MIPFTFKVSLSSPLLWPFSLRLVSFSLPSAFHSLPFLLAFSSHIIPSPFSSSHLLTFSS
jgi:hypothetical protein